MPKKARPSPLAESIFQQKLAELQSTNEATDVSELPVHNTFIQFGSPTAVEDEKQRLSTAPAWIGTTSFQSAVNSAMQTANRSPTGSDANKMQPSLPSLPGTADSEDSLSSSLWLISPKKVPVVRYSENGSHGADSAIAAALAQAAVPPQPPLATAVPTPAGPPPAAVASGGSSAEDAPQADEAQAKDAEDEAPPAARRAPRGPLAAPGEMPSLGSAQHNDGLCKRCCFFPKGRCQNGFNCEFCHLEHDKRKRKKKKKSKSKTQDDSDDSDSGDDDQENKAPGTAGKAGDAETGSARQPSPSPSGSEPDLAGASEHQQAAGQEPQVPQITATPPAAPTTPVAPPPAMPPRLPPVPEALPAAAPLPSTYESWFASEFAALPAAIGTATAPGSLAAAPLPLGDASARVPASAVQYMDPMAYMAGYSVAAPVSPGFQPGMCCQGAQLLPPPAPCSPLPPAPPSAALPPSLQGANAVQAGVTVQNASVLPGVGLPPPR